MKAPEYPIYFTIKGFPGYYVDALQRIVKWERGWGFGNGTKHERWITLRTRDGLYTLKDPTKKVHRLSMQDITPLLERAHFQTSSNTGG